MAEEKQSGLTETEAFQRAADILKTVAHPARLKIIDFLEGGERAVAEICRHLDLPQPYVSQQLNLMKAREILKTNRKGTQVYYSIANLNVVKIIHCIRQHSATHDGAGSSFSADVIGENELVSDACERDGGRD